ncbi:MAG: ABC transporter substrate-binding protein [Comamonas sp. SCN 65-56]|nr:MAG: ABC transporter substrate-binding protein [Comamonas sp. SCN 65-56]
MNEIHMDAFDLNLLRVLEAMLSERSVTRAARSLDMTQSAASHALNRLREFFDDPLFVKSGNAMVPTPKAESLQPAVFDVMSTVRQRIRMQAVFQPQSAQREFVLCITDMGELVFLPTLLRRLRLEAPQCSLRTLQVPAEQIEQLLASGSADLAIGSYRTAPDGLYKQRLFMHSFVTIAHADNTRWGRRISLEQFEQTPQIVVTLTGREPVAYDKVLEDTGIRRTVVLRTPHFLMVPLLLEQNPELIATVPLELGNVFARLGIVRMLEPPLELPTFAINQYWHPLFHREPGLVWLRELIKQSFETYPDIYTGPPPAHAPTIGRRGA